MCVRKEPVDVVEVERLLKELPPCHQDIYLLKHAQKYARDGYYEAEYRYAKDLSFGRLFASRGLQRMSRAVRSRCAGRGIVEIDVRNCFPTLLEQVQNRFEILAPVLAYYNANRDVIIAEIMRTHIMFDRDNVKQMFLASQHQGSYLNVECNRGVRIDFLDKFQAEMRANVTKLLPKYPELLKLAHDLEKPFVRGTCVAWICQIVEAKVLTAAIEFAERTHDVFTNEFDGFLMALMARDGTLGFDTAGCSDYVYAKTGYRVQFEIKPLVPKLMPPDLYSRTCDA